MGTQGLSKEEIARLPAHIERAFRDEDFSKKVDFFKWAVSFQGTHNVQRIPSKDRDAFLAALLTTDHVSESARMARFFEGEELEALVRTIEECRHKTASNWILLAKSRPQDIDWIQARFLKDVTSQRDGAWPNLLDWIQRVPTANMVPVQFRMAELGMWKELVQVTFAYDYVSIFVTIYCMWTMQSNQTRNDNRDGSPLNLILHLQGARRQEALDTIKFLLLQTGRGQVWTTGLQLWQAELLGAIRERTRSQGGLLAGGFAWDQVEDHAIQCWSLDSMQLYHRHIQRNGPIDDFLTVEEIMES